MQKQFLAFIFLLATASAFAQPLYVQSNIGANTDPIPYFLIVCRL